MGKDSNAAVITIRLRQGRLGHIWQPIRKQLFTELLRPEGNSDSRTTGLMRILANRFPQWATVCQGGSGGLMSILQGRNPNTRLGPYLERDPQSAMLDFELRRVLSHLTDPELNGIAADWLRGEQLGEEDLTRLKLSTESLSPVERESRASEVVSSFLQLVGNSTLLVLCFDEVEAIQSGNWDKAVLREFATAAVTIQGIEGPRVVITTLRFNLHTDLREAADVTSLQKLATTGPIFFKMLTWEQMLRIVHARIRSEPTCKLERQHYPPESDWPLTRPFLEEFYRENKLVLTPRHILMACARKFDQIKQATVEGPSEPDPLPLETPGVPDVHLEVKRGQSEEPKATKSPTDAQVAAAVPESEQKSGVSAQLRNLLNRSWNDVVKKANELPDSVHFDDVFGITLPWLARLLGLPFDRSDGKNSGVNDVNLVFYSQTRNVKSLGVSLCSDLPPQLWRRLDRLYKQWDASKNRTLASLHLLRAEVQYTSDASLARFKRLEQAKVQVHWLPNQTIAEMAGYHHLLIEVQKGDLTRPSGRQISWQEYNDWARDHVLETQSVKELLIQVFGPLPEERPALPNPGKAGKPAPTNSAVAHV
jgi:hypothetical protein